MSTALGVLYAVLITAAIVILLGMLYTILDVWEEHDERKAYKRRLRHEAEAWKCIMSQTEGDAKAYAAANVLHCTYLAKK